MVGRETSVTSYSLFMLPSETIAIASRFFGARGSTPFGMTLVMQTFWMDCKWRKTIGVKTIAVLETRVNRLIWTIAWCGKSPLPFGKLIGNLFTHWDGVREGRKSERGRTFKHSPNHSFALPSL
jgi:hypothetical protein